MTETPVKCPCCGQTTRGENIRVDLGENMFYFNGQGMRLQPRLAELAFILARRMPETVSHDVIIGQMWGDAEPASAENSIKVAVGQLRIKLRTIGLTIVNTWARGYRMEVMPAMSRTERNIPLTEPAAHAHA